VLPGATIGVFGSGQLGRMFALAARRMGYHIHTFSSEHNSPTGQVADREVQASYDDLDAVGDFIQSVDALTFEFENVASVVAELAEEAGKPVRPGGWVLHTTQNRLREKQFLHQAGLPVTPFAAVNSLADLQLALASIGCPAVLKSAAFGYDGKGQVRIDRPAQAEDAWQAIGGQPAVLEAWVDLAGEFSVVAARGVDGAFAHYGVIENSHAHHILDFSVAPARITPALEQEAVTLTHSVLEQLAVVGVLCVEFFLTGDGRLLINELAPRPHNSGHWTVEGAITSQFEQQVRAVCGLPLGSTERLRPAAMVNLFGDLWFGPQGSREPNWQAALATPSCKLHLYGKATARPGRKMGHLTVLAVSVEEALALAQRARTALVEEKVNNP
jgi:5-(carboxyamino)imidazole ribonucleotide synthase